MHVIRCVHCKQGISWDAVRKMWMRVARQGNTNRNGRKIDDNHDVYICVVNGKHEI